MLCADKLARLFSFSLPIMNLLKSLAAISSMTMMSRVLGFIRDAIIARVFGAGAAADAFLLHSNCPICCAEFLPRAHFHKRLCQY